VVDDFGIKYVGQEHEEHLKASIDKHYQISCDWTGSAYYGLQLDWDYKNKFVDLSMPAYIKSAVHKLQHPTAPPTRSPPVYGAKTHYSEAHQDIPLLPQKDVTHIQHLASTLLHYVRAMDPPLILPVNVLASEQTQTTITTVDKVITLLNYCATHPEEKVWYHASEMILNIHSDSSYLSERESKSRAGGFFYIRINIDSKNKLTNGAVLIIITILRHVMSSASETELRSVFLSAKEATILRTTLEEMGHPHQQPPTPLQYDNTTATGYSNDTIKQRRTRAMNMRFYWVNNELHLDECY
jgi:hypothetical protein